MIVIYKIRRQINDVVWSTGKYRYCVHTRLPLYFLRVKIRIIETSKYDLGSPLRILPKYSISENSKYLVLFARYDSKFLKEFYT